VENKNTGGKNIFLASKSWPKIEEKKNRSQKNLVEGSN
jgi:hypothetical protein